MVDGEARIYQSINQTSLAPISLAKPGSVERQPNQCSTAKSRKQFRNINRPWGVTVSMGERPNQRDLNTTMTMTMLGRTKHATVEAVLQYRKKHSNVCKLRTGLCSELPYKYSINVVEVVWY